MYKVIYILFILLSGVPSSMAAVSLSITPLDGTNSLRLENVATGLTNKKEVRVRITSTSGNRYQVFQRLLEPMVNEKGDALDSQAIQTAAYNNTNSGGTLYMQNAERMGLSEQHLYTSGQGGESDSFIVGYSVSPDQIQASGRFTGRLAFIVRSVGDGAQDQMILNVTLESPSNQEVKIVGSRAPSRVSIRDTDNRNNIVDFVKVSFSGNKGDIRIYQEVDSWPRNTNGDELNPDVLQYYVSGSSSGNAHEQGLAAVGLNRMLVYAGNAKDDAFSVYWLLDPEKVQAQDSGTYKGVMKYVVESSSGKEAFSIDLESFIQPVFKLTVNIPPEGVTFDRVLPDSPPQEREIDVAVHSNLHKPYQVVQGLLAGLTNEKGEQIDTKYVTIKVELSEGQKGQSKFVDFSPLETSENPVFISDGQGSPVSFKIIYKFKGYPGMIPGKFLAPVRFTLQEN